MAHLTITIQFFKYILNRGVNMYIEIIVLYLKSYISTNDFEKILYDNIDSFEEEIEEDIIYELINADYNSKENIIHLKKCLNDYITSNYLSLFKIINDVFVEKIIDANKNDDITNILKKKYKKKKVIIIDCNMIYTHTDFIKIFKHDLKFPLYCGNNWDAINDLIFDVIFPSELHFVGWDLLKKRLPKDTRILKNILDKIEKSRCIILYT